MKKSMLDVMFKTGTLLLGTVVAITAAPAMAWNIVTPGTNDEYWYQSDIDTAGTGDSLSAYTVRAKVNTITYQSAQGDADAEGNWDEMLEPPEGGWPVSGSASSMDIKLYKRTSPALEEKASVTITILGPVE